MNQFYKSIFLTLVILWFSKDINAQSNKTIKSDRPGQAIVPFTIGKNNFQSQTGFNIGGLKYYDNFNFIEYRLVNTFLKYGLSERFELNGGIGYSKYWFKDYSGLNLYQGFNNATLGFRINILNGKNFKPSLGFQFSENISIYSSNNLNRINSPKIMFTLNQKISQKINLLVNLGALKNSTFRNTHGLYVLNVNYAITPKVSVFIENYGELYRKNIRQRWDTGLGFLVNNNLQLDISGGIGPQFFGYTYFASVGVSWKLVPKQK